MSDPLPVCDAHLRRILRVLLDRYVRLPDRTWPTDDFVTHAREIAQERNPRTFTPVATWGP